MASSSSNRVSGASTAPVTPTVPPDDRDYLHPGVFVMPWRPLFIVEDEPTRARAMRELAHVDVPWDMLATLKLHAPDVAETIVICGWEGVSGILRRLELAVLARVRDGIRL